MTATATLNKSVLEEAREDFIVQWGALGTAWGINRTMYGPDPCFSIDFGRTVKHG